MCPPLPSPHKWFSEQSWNWKSNKSPFHWQPLAEDWSDWLRYSCESQSLQVEWMATESLRQYHADRETISVWSVPWWADCLRLVVDVFINLWNLSLLPTIAGPVIHRLRCDKWRPEINRKKALLWQDEWSCDVSNRELKTRCIFIKSVVWQNTGTWR